MPASHRYHHAVSASDFFLMAHLLPWSSGLEAIFYFYAAGSLIDYMLEDLRATTDELFAAGATFTLLAWGFTHLYMLIQILHPGAYAAAVNPENMRTWTELNYLSFALLSSTDIWFYSPDTKATIVLDRHNLVFIYGLSASAEVEILKHDYKEGYGMKL